MEFEPCPPYAPSLMESTRAIGYSLESAIADVIDNSIAAGATRVDVLFRPGISPHIAILDNGSGMSRNELKTAMRYGSRSPVEQREARDLGRYGLGLKTASLSQCKQLTVVSVKDGVRVACRWDLDFIHEKQDWLLQFPGDEVVDRLPGVDRLRKSSHGTLVLWKNLDRLEQTNIDISSSLSRRMEEGVREHLSLVFHRYLSGEKGIRRVVVYMNDDALAPNDPFLKVKSTQVMDVEPVSVRGVRVTAVPYLLPHISEMSPEEISALGGKDGLRKNQGFYVYRNFRLLTWGTWFRLARKSDLSKLARVQVDIPNSLDDLWSLDIKKSVALPPEDVKNHLGTIIEKVSLCSSRTWTYRGRRELPDSDVQGVWTKSRTRDGSYGYEVNRNHPLVEQLLKRFPRARLQIEKLLEVIADGLPLNSLYCDLTGDTKIANEIEKSPKEILAMLKSLVVGEMSNEKRIEDIEMFVMSKPFCDYREEISKAIKEGYFND